MPEDTADAKVIRSVLIASKSAKDAQSPIRLPFEGEEDYLDTILRTADPDTWMDRRSERLCQGLGTLPDGTKAVIFCATEGNADRVFCYLKERRIKVVRHGDGDGDGDMSNRVVVLTADLRNHPDRSNMSRLPSFPSATCPKAMSKTNDQPPCAPDLEMMLTSVSAREHPAEIITPHLLLCPNFPNRFALELQQMRLMDDTI